MTWFKLDDGFHCHPKVLEAGNEAIGLYVRCGSWVSQQLTDGFVPTSIALLYGGRDLAEALVGANLWTPVTGGWQMHDYLTYNPSKDQVQADRHAAAERQKRARERAKAAREAKQAAAQGGHGVTNDDSHASSHAVTHAVTEDDGVTTSGDDDPGLWSAPESHAVTAPVSHAAVTPVVTVPPTRPDPTRNYKEPSITADAAMGVEAEFEQWWTQWPRKIAKQAALASYRKARTKKHIPAELLLTTAADQIAAWRAAGREQDKIPHATTWLNQGRWDDEVERPKFTVITNPDSPWQGYRIDDGGSPWAADMGWTS